MSKWFTLKKKKKNGCNNLILQVIYYYFNSNLSIGKLVYSI